MNRILLFAVLFFCAGCKKDKLPDNIVESTVDFNSDTTDVVELQSRNIFIPTASFLAYFSAAAGLVAGEIVFIGTESPYDHDFAYSDLQIKRTDTDLNIIGDQKLFRANAARLNSVTPSLIQLDNVLQFYYLRQESLHDAQIYLIESADQGKTWENERKISFQSGFNGIINDRVTVLSSGRIIIPVAFTPDIDNSYNEQYIFCYYSDDKGITWKKSQELKASIPLMEPSLAEYGDGKLLMVIRSELGKLLFSRSLDYGVTWSVVEKSRINSPVSTSALFKIDQGVLALIWNHTTPSIHVLDRKPLTLSLSKDEGKSWSLPYKIGKEEGEIYSSPGMFKNGSDWFVYFNYSGYVGEYGIRAKKIKIKY